MHTLPTFFDTGKSYSEKDVYKSFSKLKEVYFLFKKLMKFMNDFGLITARDPNGKYHSMTDVIHKVLNDLTIDDWWVIIGGDSHTRMSKGVAFGADSGTVALALATGEVSMPIPESVKVTFKGEMAANLDFRDVVHATQSQMLDKFGNMEFEELESEWFQMYPGTF